MVSITVKRHHDHCKSYKENIQLGLLMVSEVQSIIMTEGHGSVQADVVLEKELRVLHLYWQATGSKLTRCSLNIADLKAPPPQ